MIIFSFLKVNLVCTATGSIYDKLTQLIDDGKSIDKVYLDFKKA